MSRSGRETNLKDGTPLGSEISLRSLLPVGVLLALPLVGLAVLLARPALDLEWQHQPSHFWLVLLVALVNVALGFLTHEAAGRRGDARLLLVSLALITSAGFLGLHALATPRVLLPGPNAGFAVAAPFGLTLAAAFAAASAMPLGGPRGSVVVRHRRLMLWSVVGLMVGWATASLLQLPPLSPIPSPEVIQPLRFLSLAGVALYAFAAIASLRLYRSRGRPLALAVMVALVLLAEAMITIAFSRDWHLSWWEWHVLMAVAFAGIALGARIEYGRSRSLSGTFGGLYLEGTLERLDRWHASALGELAATSETDSNRGEIVRRLRDEGASDEQVAVMERAADELHRIDETFRSYLPERVAEQVRTDPRFAELGGETRDVTVLFADLAGFTAFSERTPPTRVVEMLNACWARAVPIVESEGGIIEGFAGDGLLAVFNALGDQPDHPLRASRCALRMRDAGEVLSAGSGDRSWPRFHIGINTGPALVGNVGVTGRRSFAAIGETVNLASRLMTAAAAAGEVVVGSATWDALGTQARGVHLGGLRLDA